MTTTPTRAWHFLVLAVGYLFLAAVAIYAVLTWLHRGRPERGLLPITLDMRHMDDGSIVDVIEMAKEGGNALEDLDEDSIYPLHVVATEAPNVFLADTYRGRERITVAGCRVHDALPGSGCQDWLDPTAVAALERWLRSGEPYETGWCSGNTRGPRSVHLLSLRWSGNDQWAQDAALEEGWCTRTAPVLTLCNADPDDLMDLVLEVKSAPFPMHPPPPDRREPWQAEADALAAMSQAQLQQAGASLLQDCAQVWHWKPRAELEFRWCDHDELATVLEQLWNADFEADHRLWVQKIEAWNRENPDQPRLEAGQQVTIDHETAVNFTWLIPACSPPGPVIYLLRGQSWDLRCLHEILVHEIAHQYQEEMQDVPAPEAIRPGTFVPGMAGSEAYAELLTLRLACEMPSLGFPERCPWTRNAQEFQESAGEAGMDVDSYYRERQQDSPRSAAAASGHDTAATAGVLQQAESPPHAGLQFERESPQLLRVRNAGDTLFVGVFNGVFWRRRTGDPEHNRVPMVLAPFNLILPPGRSVRLYSQDGAWKTEAEFDRIDGDFSVTPDPVLD